MIKKLDWDSEFFNLKIGEVHIESDNYDLEDNTYDLLYVKSEKEISINIPGFENTFTDQTLIYTKDLDKNPAKIDFTGIIPFD